MGVVGTGAKVKGREGNSEVLALLCCWLVRLHGAYFFFLTPTY